MSKVRFVDNVGVNAFGNVSPEAIITASGGVGNIIFTKENGNQIILPLATTQSSADSLVTASVLNNTITFTKGDLSTFSVTVDTGSSGESVNTGSLLTTGSANLNVLTFSKGDGTSFTLTVDTGSGVISAGTVSSSAQITALGFVTSSATASFITNSQTSSMSVLSAQTASYVLNAVSSSHAVFAISASYAVSSSHEIIKEISSSHANFADTASKSLDNVLTASATNNVITFTKGDTSTFTVTIDTGSGEPLPSGTVSSSTQISKLGFVTSSATASFITNSQTSSMSVLSAQTASYVLNAVSSSFSSFAISASYAVSSSHEIIKEISSSHANFADTASKSLDNVLTASVVNNIITFTKGDTSTFSLTVDTGSGEPLPSGTVSSSAQISEFGFVTSSATASFITNSQTGSFVTNSQTSSMSVLLAQTASYVETAQTASYVTSSNIVGNFTTSSIINFPTEVSRSAAAAGFGAGGESIPSGTVSSSAQITNLGFVQSSITASSLETASVSSNTITFTKGNGDTFSVTVNTGSGTSIDTGSFVQNSQTSSMTVGTASIANFIPFNGNRAISNQDQPLGIRNVNFNANGLADFIEKVYFTNTAPVITTSNFTIGEFVTSGSTVGTVTATDAESGSQTITFSTSSTYVADQFRIHSGSGVITLNVKSTSSMNTFGSGSPAIDVAPFPVVATDTFGLTGSKTIFIRVTPNTAPIWSTVQDGSLTTSATASLSESSALGNDKDRYYFRDSESDTITIGSGSSSTHFTTAFRLVKTSDYIRLDQITASLDFDLYPTYSFVLTASDEHYESGDDPNSIAYLPVRINILDDLPPTIDPQTLGGINENSTTGAVAGTVSATNNDGGTITFSGFTLKSANKDGGTNITSSLGGTSLLDPSSDPFTINSGTGQVTRKSGQFFNSDIANRYIYTVTVIDNLNPSSNSADITIPIANDVASTVTDNWTNLYIIESARTGEFIKNVTNGFGGSTAQWSSAVSQRWDLTSNPDFIEVTNLTASATQLRLSTNLSGSATTGGDTINLALTASENAFFTTKQLIDQNVSVVAMTPPQWSTSDQSSNLNTNGARPSNNLVLASVSDVQSYGIDHSTFTFTPNAGQALEAVQNGGADSYYIRPTANLAAGTYGYTASIFNNRGFTAGELKDEFTIAQAPIGSLTTNGTFRIIESAVSGANIVTNLDGRTGTQADLGVNYGSGFNSPSVQSFTSSNAAIAVTDTGLLSMAVNVSGSPSSSGDTFTSDITYRDQFDNIGSGSISVAVRPNSAPSATITPVSPTLEAPQNAGTKLADVSISDTEGDTPFNLSLTGTDAASLVAFPTNAVSSSYEIRLAGNVTGSDSFTYNAVVTDNFGSTQTYSNQTLSIDAVPIFWYAYLPEVGAYATDISSCLSSYGDANDDGTLDSNLPFYDMANGNLGDSVITSSGLTGVSAEFSFLVASGSAITASRTNLFLDGIDQTVGQQGFTGLIIVFPSGSSNFLQPESMGVTLGDSTSGRYLMFGDSPGTGVNDNPRTSAVRYFDFIGGNQYPNGTETRFGTIFLPGESNSNLDYFLMSASGSAPTSQQ